MPVWIAWIRDHWLSFILAVGAVVAVLYVWADRKKLFYKE